MQVLVFNTNLTYMRTNEILDILRVHMFVSHDICIGIFQRSHDPCMFKASKIRRATELKAPFIQCHKFFHTVTLTELHGNDKYH